VSVSSNGRRRVVISGLGCVSPLGNSVDASWQNLLAGESGAGEITQFDHSSPAYNVHFACELKDFDPTTWIESQVRASNGSLRADDPRRRAPGRDRFGHRHLEGTRTCRRVGCDGHRRPPLVSGLPTTCCLRAGRTV